MKCAFSVVVLVAIAVGAFAVPSGYMYYKPGKTGIMYVQYQKPGSESSGVSAFVAGDSGDTMTVVDGEWFYLVNTDQSFVLIRH